VIKMQEIIITGNSDYARLIREYVDDLEDFRCVAFTVDGAYIKENSIDGLNVVAFEEIQNFYNADSVKLVLAIGYQKLGRTRRDIFSRYCKLGYDFVNYIHPSAQIDKTAVIGKGNIFLESVIVQKHVRIGNGNLFWHRAVISHDDIIGNFNSFCPNSVICGFVKIGNCSFFGANSTVKDKIEIADFNLIGSCAYVNNNTSENQTILPVQCSPVNYTADTMAIYL